MAQGALVFHGTSACTGRPFDGWSMYTDIDCEHTLTFQLLLKSLQMLEVISTAGPNHMNCCDSYNFMAKFN